MDQSSLNGSAHSVVSSRTAALVSWFVETPLVLHILVVSVILVVLLPFTKPADIWTSDEGAIRFQVELLATTGSWSAERPFYAIDPEEITSPIHASTIVGKRYSPYTKQPALPLMLVPLRRSVGAWGLVIPSLLGTLTASVLGALIAGTFAKRTRNMTLWVLAFATPLFFYGYTVLAHTLATAMAAAALFLVIRAGDRVSLRWLLAIVAVALSSMLRAEAVAYGVALAIAVSLAQPTVRWRVKGTLSVLLAVSALSAAAVSRMWAVIVGGAVPVAEGQGVLDWFRFVSGVFSSLVLTDFGTFLPLIVVFLMNGGIALLVLSVDREPNSVWLHRVLAATGVAGSLLLVALIPEAVGGLLAATPFLLAGLLLLRRSEAADPSMRFILVTSALFAAAVFATQERGGGGAQWGGRYLMLALPGLAPVALLALRSLYLRRPSARTLVTVPLVLASLVLTLDAAIVLRTGRENSASLTNQLAELGREVGASGDRPTIISPRTHIGRHAWRTIGDIDYLLVPSEEFDEYVRRLVATEPNEFGVVGSWTDDRATLFSSLGYEAVDIEDEPFLIVVPIDR